MISIKMNNRMKRFYTKTLSLSESYNMLNPQLKDILHDGFDEVDQCILLHHELNLSSHVSHSSFPDKTGYEEFVNHLYINDYISERRLKYTSIIISLGIAFTTSLAHELSLRFSDKSFCVSLGVDSKELAISEGLDVSEVFDVSVSFHQERDGEIWLVEDLEEYQYEAILVIEVKGK